MQVYLCRSNDVYITFIGAHMSTGRLKEYFILVSNVFTLAETHVCYTQPPGFINTSILEEDCQSTARYLWFYQNKTFDGGSPMLEICEVQVFGMISVSLPRLFNFGSVVVLHFLIGFNEQWLI